MRGVLSLDLILTAIFVMGIYGVSGTLVKHSLVTVEHYLAEPVCLMYAQNLADAYAATGGGTVTVTHLPANIVSASVSGGVAHVEVNGMTGVYSCEVKAP
ncbi:MAG: hypothetical protein GXN93_05275 [Candidatus Diapherotrites archaeon]|nr:hypothetical protein [Candidatus Diapherotrites archaeon]